MTSSTDRLTPERLEDIRLFLRSTVGVSIEAELLSEIDALRADVARVTQERDEVAAALEVLPEEWTRERFVRLYYGDRICDAVANLIAVVRKRLDPAAILVARDSEQRRLGAAKWCREKAAEARARDAAIPGDRPIKVDLIAQAEWLEGEATELEPQAAGGRREGE